MIILDKVKNQLLKMLLEIFSSIQQQAKNVKENLAKDLSPTEVIFLNREPNPEIALIEFDRDKVKLETIDQIRQYVKEKTDQELRLPEESDGEESSDEREKALTKAKSLIMIEKTNCMNNAHKISHIRNIAELNTNTELNQYLFTHFNVMYNTDHDADLQEKALEWINNVPIYNDINDIGLLQICEKLVEKREGVSVINAFYQQLLILKIFKLVEDFSNGSDPFKATICQLLNIDKNGIKNKNMVNFLMRALNVLPIKKSTPARKALSESLIQHIKFPDDEAKSIRGILDYVQTLRKPTINQEHIRSEKPANPDAEPANPDVGSANPDAGPANPDAEPANPDAEPANPAQKLQRLRQALKKANDTQNTSIGILRQSIQNINYRGPFSLRSFVQGATRKRQAETNKQLLQLLLYANCSHKNSERTPVSLQELLSSTQTTYFSELPEDLKKNAQELLSELKKKYAEPVRFLGMQVHERITKYFALKNPLHMQAIAIDRKLKRKDDTITIHLYHAQFDFRNYVKAKDAVTQAEAMVTQAEAMVTQAEASMSIQRFAKGYIIRKKQKASSRLTDAVNSSSPNAKPEAMQKSATLFDSLAKIAQGYIMRITPKHRKP